MAKLGLILLAAGQAQRMGQPKQLMTWRGESLLNRAARVALSVAQPVVIVTGAHAKACHQALADLPVETVHNPDWQHGIGTSIRKGISQLINADVNGAIIALADQPLIDEACYQRLISLYQQQRHTMVVAEYAGTVGVPALFDRSLFDDMLKLPPDRGCKALIMAHPPLQLGRCSCPEAAIDIDTASDYQQLIAKFG